MARRMSLDAPRGVISLTGVVVASAGATRFSYMDDQTPSAAVVQNNVIRCRRVMGEHVFEVLRAAFLAGAQVDQTTITLWVNGVATAMKVTIGGGDPVGQKYIDVRDIHINSQDDIDLRIDCPAGGGEGNTAFFSATLEYYT